jgi:chromosomal replication initiator protein
MEHMVIDESALHYIAEHIVSNIRELEGALNTIINFARLKKTNTIDIELAKEALKDIIEPDENRPITPELIISTVIEQFNFQVSADDIKGKNRSRDVAYPRQICMYLCCKYTGLSQAAIGAALGNKDHTTIIHGKNKIEEDIRTDENVRNMIDIIVKKLNPPK